MVSNRATGVYMRLCKLLLEHPLEVVQLGHDGVQWAVSGFASAG